MAENELERLKQDNENLKKELKAQQAVCQKLRDEKDFSNSSLLEAEEEIRYCNCV